MNKKLTLLAIVLAIIMIAGCGSSKAPTQETTAVTTIQTEQETVAPTVRDETVPTETFDLAESNKSIAPPKPTEASNPTETTRPATEAPKPTETTPSATEVPKPTETIPPETKPQETKPVIDEGVGGVNDTPIL